MAIAKSGPLAAGDRLLDCAAGTGPMRMEMCSNLHLLQELCVTSLF